MIIDSHCHIYPEKIAPRAVQSVDRFYDGLPMGHLDGTTGTLLSIGKAAGITHFVVHSVATTSAQVHSINHFISDAQALARGAFIGLGALHPDSEDLRADIEELKSLGLHGVKIHPDFQRFEIDSERAFALYELCEEYGLPVLIHTGDHRYDFSNPERTARALSAFPRLKIIGAHFGGWSVWDDAERLLPRFPSLLVDTSSSFFWMKPDRALRIIRAFGAERVMFGTDYPMWSPRPELDYLNALPLTDEERERILWKNCAELYGLDADDKEINTDA